MKSYKNLLETSSLKTTPQRLAILKVLDEKGHANIDEIYEDIKEIFPSLSLATIYKNITSLKEEGIITEVCSPNKTKFEINKGEHGHFICQKCGKIEDFELDNKITNSIEEKYPDTKKEIYIYGICKSCKDDNS